MPVTVTVCYNNAERRKLMAVYRPMIDRFTEKTVAGANECIIWIGAKHKQGYGQLGKSRSKGTVLAHRFSYEHYRGPIPERMVLDHLCRNVACVNPYHLEITTHAENICRGNAPGVVKHREGICFRGHPQIPANTYGITRKHCLLCRKIRDDKNREKIRASDRARNPRKSKRNTTKIKGPLYRE